MRTSRRRYPDAGVAVIGAAAKSARARSRREPWCGGAAVAIARGVVRSLGLVLIVTLAVVASVAASARADSVDATPPLTHTTPLTPTGDVVPRGHFQRTQSVTAFVHHMAIGLGGGAELSLTSPLLPIPIA